MNRLFNVDYLPCLCHGDLSPNNMLMGQDGRAYLIDFGCARVHMSHYNLITVGAQTHAERRAFLEGYGLSGEDYRKQEPEYALFSILHHFDTLRWAIDHLPKANWRPYVIQAKQAVAHVFDQDRLQPWSVSKV